MRALRIIWTRTCIPAQSVMVVVFVRRNGRLQSTLSMVIGSGESGWQSNGYHPSHPSSKGEPGCVLEQCAQTAAVHAAYNQSCMTDIYLHF